jgi:hypothetical protein
MGACSAGSGHVQFLDTTTVESLYGEKHESEAQSPSQGPRSAWDAPANINGQVVFQPTTLWQAGLFQSELAPSC